MNRSHLPARSPAAQGSSDDVFNAFTGTAGRLFNAITNANELHERNQFGIMPGMESVSDHLRRALQECGEPMSEIAERTGINKSVLSRFVSSGRELRSANLDRLCEYLGLRLTATPARKRKER